MPGSGKPQIGGCTGYAGIGSSLKIPRGLLRSGGTSQPEPNGALAPAEEIQLPKRSSNEAGEHCGPDAEKLYALEKARK
jgi:hypothetical protein